MTTEQIIQRLLDEKHITAAEAVQMIRDLVRNEIFTPLTTNSKKTPCYPPTVVMYGVSVDPSDDWANGMDSHYNTLSSDKPKED